MDGDLIFVTGGTGFLGRHLVLHLVSLGYRVRILIRTTSDISWLPLDQIELVYGDVNNPQTLLDGMRGCRYVVHAAGLFRFWGPHELFDRINLEGTKNAANAALANGVEKLIFISTVAVVGNPGNGVVIDEETVCNPQDGYQHSKLSAERALLEMHASIGLPAVILRPGAFYGPGSYYGFNRLFVIEALQGLRVKVAGGRRLTFPVFVPDVTKVIAAGLEKGIPGEVYICSDISRTHNEINQIVSKLLGISPWRLSVPRFGMIALAAAQEGLSKLTQREPFYPLNLRHYVFNDWNVSSKKAEEVLDFKPTPIEIGLEDTIKWIMRTRVGRI